MCATVRPIWLLLKLLLELLPNIFLPDALVLIETTVAPGTTEQVAYPIMKKVFKKRGIRIRSVACTQL